MTTIRLLCFAILILMTVEQTLTAQTFRSKNSGNWTNPASWQIQSGESWADAITFPGQTNGIQVVTIQAGNKLYISPGADITINDITVEATGKLTVHPGAKISIANKMDLLANPAAAAIEVSGVQPAGTIATLDCDGATLSGTITEGEAADGVSVSVAYTDGNADIHFGQTVQSAGVTGLTAVLDAGSFASGSGGLTYIIAGTPSEAGTASFALIIGGQSCMLSLTVNASFSCTDIITFTYRGEPVTYGLIERCGLCWMDRNLGADPMPFVPADDATGNTDTRLYGDLFQWGRLDDGHQNRNSVIIFTLSNTDVPGHAGFIPTNSFPHDWRQPENNNLWQGEYGINNPCPDGWRVPTGAELNAERESWSPNNSAGAYASTLKWPLGGLRDSNGSLYSVGSYGLVWGSSVSVSNASLLSFGSGIAYVASSYRASGSSVRCVRDN